MKFRLDHLSGSTINSFIENKPSFFKNKIERAGFSPNPNMCRGKAVEHVIQIALEDSTAMQSKEEINKTVIAAYDEELRPWALSRGSSYNKLNDDIRDTLPRMAQLGINTYRNLYAGKMVHCQVKVIGQLPGLDFDIIGYEDFVVFGQEVSDCKVVKKSAKRLSQGYCISGAFYRLASNLPVFYDLLVCNKQSEKHVRLPLTNEDYEFGISYAVAAGNQILKINKEEDPAKVMNLIMEFPDLDAAWDKVEKKELADKFDIKLRACDLEDED